MTQPAAPEFPRFLAPILGPEDSGSYVGSVDVINPNTPDAELLQMLRVPLPWANPSTPLLLLKGDPELGRIAAQAALIAAFELGWAPNDFSRYIATKVAKYYTPAPMPALGRALVCWAENRLGCIPAVMITVTHQSFMLGVHSSQFSQYLQQRPNRVHRDCLKDTLEVELWGFQSTLHRGPLQRRPDAIVLYRQALRVLGGYLAGDAGAVL